MPRASQTHGTAAIGVGRQNLLDHDLELPVVAEVVPVDEATARRRSNILEPHVPIGQTRGDRHVGIGHPVALAADDELVEIGIDPAHQLLDQVVELVECQDSRDEDASPDWRLDVREGDRELVGDRPVQASGAGPFRPRCVTRHRGVTTPDLPRFYPERSA